MIDVVEYVSTVLELAHIPQLDGIPIKRDSQSAQEDNTVTISVVDGNPPTMFFGQSDGLSYPFVQLQFRNKSSETTTLQCLAVKDLFSKYHDSIIGGFIRIGDIVTLGRDPLGRMEKLLNFRIIVKE